MTDANKQNNNKSESIEKPAGKKTHEPTTSFFKWFSPGAVTILLILAIYFQAPWKIITFLAIILAVCTLLPKPVRTGLWLAFIVLFIVMMVWVILPEEDIERWRPYSFDEELATLEAKYAVPDEENAATIYNTLLEDYSYQKFNPDFLDHDLDIQMRLEPWTSQEYPEIAQWHKEHGDTIQTLFQAVQKNKFQFPLNVQLMVRDKLEINLLPAFRSWGLLLIRAGNNDIAEGRTDRALEKYICALRTANHLNQLQKMIDLLVSFFIEDLALRQLDRFVIEGEPTTEQLQLISDSIDNLQNNWSSDFSKCLETDELFWKNAFGLLYDINSKGKVRFSRNPAPVMRNLFFNKWLGGFFREKKPHRIYAVLAWFFLPSTPEKAAETIETTMESFGQMTRPDFDWTDEPKEPDMRFKLNYSYTVKTVVLGKKNAGRDNYYRFFHDKYLEHIILRRGSRLLIAIRQYKDKHGSWPSSLEEIKSTAPAEAFLDPVTGNPLEYENHSERFSLYGAKTNVWPR